MNRGSERSEPPAGPRRDGNGAATRATGRRRSKWIVPFVLVVVAATAWWFVRSSPEERSARQDAAAVGAVVADYVAAQGRLPRVTVSPLLTRSGDVQWGEDFLVETHKVPRADPSQARGFYIVGDAGDWCVEMAYEAPRFLEDSSPPGWVAVKGALGEPGRVVGGRCGVDYILTLSPVTVRDVPTPGSVIDAVGAPVGTCTADPYAGEAPPGDPQLTGTLEVAGCDAEHFGEIFHTGKIEAADYALYQDTAANTCAAELEAFIGVPRSLSAFTGEGFTVSEERWDAEERTFSCVLFLGTEAYPLVGSARDSWR